MYAESIYLRIRINTSTSFVATFRFLLFLVYQILNVEIIDYCKVGPYYSPYKMGLMNGVSGIVSGNGPPCITSTYDTFNPQKRSHFTGGSACGSDSGTSMPDLFASRHAAVEESTPGETRVTECNVELLGPSRVNTNKIHSNIVGSLLFQGSW